MAAVYDAAAALAEFHESRGGVRGLVESGVATVPPIFLMPPEASPLCPSPTAFPFPVVDLSLPRADIVELVRTAVTSYGLFYVTNHGLHAGTIIDSAISAVRTFHEQTLAARSTFYSTSHAGAVAYSTMTHPLPRPGQPVTSSLLPWRDTLTVLLKGSAEPDDLPPVCRDALLEYHRFLTGFGKEMTSLLSEALGLPSERLDQALQVESPAMVCHYYPPCPEPSRVVGAREHTDPGLFTVLAQDGVGGLQVRLNQGGDGCNGGWVDVAPMTGALLVNIADLLKLISNDGCKSVEHRVVVNAQDARVSIGHFFRPAKCGESEFFGPLPEFLTEGRPAHYRRLTYPQLMKCKRERDDPSSSLDLFKMVYD